MIRPTLVVKQICAASIRRHEHIQCSIVINVRVSRAPRHLGTGESHAHRLRYFLKLAASKIAKQVRRFRVLTPLWAFLISFSDLASAIRMFGHPSFAEAKKKQPKPNVNSRVRPDPKPRAFS